MLKLTALNEIIVVTCVAVILGLVHMFCAQFVSLRHGGSFLILPLCSQDIREALLAALRNLRVSDAPQAGVIVGPRS